jgi:hypothetical protein
MMLEAVKIIRMREKVHQQHEENKKRPMTNVVLLLLHSPPVNNGFRRGFIGGTPLVEAEE